jgi:apolipoprotein N-acyltransferase
MRVRSSEDGRTPRSLTLKAHPNQASCGWLKPFRDIPLIRSRYLLAMVAGLALAACFPNIGIAGLAWVAPGLMLAAAMGSKDTFRLGYVAGLAHYLTSLYWLLNIPYRWHSIPLAPVTGWMALSAFLALLPATWVWLVAGSSRLSTAEQGQGSNGPALGPLASVLPGTWGRRTLWALSGAAIWVALEMTITRLFGGFPWNLLGASQYQMLPLIQIAAVTGVYGVSFLAVWFSLALFSAAVMLLRRPSLRSVWIGELFLPLLVVAGVFHLGYRQLNHPPPTARTLKVTFVQPSIPQTLIWDAANDEARFQELLQLSEQALSNRTDLLLWPEAALPKKIRYDEATFKAVTNLAGSYHVWMIIGSDDFERRPKASDPEDGDFFNSSFLISPEGKLRDRYCKRNLVIFGEYLPLARWLPFLKWFTPIDGGFTPGDGPVQFELKDLAVKTSVLICYEDGFPQIARGDVQADTDFLVNLTNDGWFGEGAAQWQQAADALFRTVENRVPLLRCTNNGLTCWVDAQGRIRQVFRDRRGTIYGAGFMTAEIPLLDQGTIRTQTFYHRHGDWFGWTCTAVAAVMLAVRLLRRFK